MSELTRRQKDLKLISIIIDQIASNIDRYRHLSDQQRFLMFSDKLHIALSALKVGVSTGLDDEIKGLQKPSSSEKDSDEDCQRKEAEKETLKEMYEKVMSAMDIISEELKALDQYLLKGSTQSEEQEQETVENHD